VNENTHCLWQLNFLNICKQTETKKEKERSGKSGCIAYAEVHWPLPDSSIATDE